MNPNAGRLSAVTGLVTEVLTPSTGPKSTNGKPQYTIVLTQATTFSDKEARPSDQDFSVRIVEGTSDEGTFGHSLIDVLGTPDEQQLLGKWVRIKYDYPKDSRWATRTVEEVSTSPL